MPETDYTFSVASDMPGGAVNLVKLDAEIIASAIATALTRTRTDVDVLTITFDDALSAGDETILHGDITGPAGGLLAAHDNGEIPEVRTLVVEADPEVTAVDAPQGSWIIWGHTVYCKEDDGLSTNVALQGHMDLRAGEAGGSTWNFVPFAADPTLVNNDLVLVEQSGIIELLFHDGTIVHLLAQSKGADIGHFYASVGGAVDIITPATFENLLKGCTLADAGLLGANWAIVNAGTDTVGFKYTGVRTKLYKLELDVNFTADEDGDVFEIQYAKNGTKDAKSFVKAECGVGADGISMRLPFVISAATDDVVSFMIDSSAGTPIVTVRTAPVLVTPL